MFCSNCGNKVEDGSKFCPECGKSLTTEAQAPAETEEKVAEAKPKKEKKPVNKKTVKLILIIFISALLVGILTFLVLFLVNPNCKFEHREYSKTTYPPTCSTNGYDMYVCTKCAYSYIEYLFDDENRPTEEHDWIATNDELLQKCSTCEATKTLSPYEILNDDEKAIYYRLTSFSGNLKNPRSLTLLDIRVGPTSPNSDEEEVFVKISATNSFGAAVSDVYVCTGSSLDTAGSGWYSVAKAWPHIGSTRKINAALEDYFNN